MPQLTESAIEELAIERLEQLGYKYLNGSVVAFDGSSPERTSYTDVILDGRLRAAVDKINPGLLGDFWGTFGWGTFGDTRKRRDKPDWSWE